jgi:hypothetical protein
MDRMLCCKPPRTRNQEHNPPGHLTTKIVRSNLESLDG